MQQQLSRFERELRVRAHGSCWLRQLLRLHSEFCWALLTPPPSVSTTTSPASVVRCGSCLEMSSLVSWSTKRRLRRRALRTSRCLPRLPVELPHGTWRVEQVWSDSLQVSEFCSCYFPDCATAFFASERDRACQTRSMSVWLTRSDKPSARPAPVPSGAFAQQVPRHLVGEIAGIVDVCAASVELVAHLQATNHVVVAV